jgi:hypothetical protein
MYALVALIAIALTVNAQIPCDEAYGQHCPEASGWEVSECLMKVESELSQDCKNYISMSETCKSDIDTHCAGKEFTGDALVCLSEWTKPELLSEHCLAALPKKETKQRTLSEAEKKKAAKRRKARKAAEKMARDL